MKQPGIERPKRTLGRVYIKFLKKTSVFASETKALYVLSNLS